MVGTKSSHCSGQENVANIPAARSRRIRTTCQSWMMTAVPTSGGPVAITL
jgi:hypothetical protein